MLNESVLNLKTQIPTNYSSLQAQYVDVCGQINFYLHDTIKLFILVGFAIFILYCIFSHTKYKDKVKDIFTQIIEIYAVSCILFFVIQVTLI
jgi:hypothetical protein